MATRSQCLFKARPRNGTPSLQWMNQCTELCPLPPQARPNRQTSVLASCTSGFKIWCKAWNQMWRLLYSRNNITILVQQNCSYLHATDINHRGVKCLGVLMQCIYIKQSHLVILKLFLFLWFSMTYELSRAIWLTALCLCVDTAGLIWDLVNH